MKELGDLLELIHGAESRFSWVRVCFRIWRHHEQAVAAFRADLEGHGGTAQSITLKRHASAPVEETERLRLWRDGDRVREKRGHRSGAESYGVADCKTCFAAPGAEQAAAAVVGCEQALAEFEAEAHTTELERERLEPARKLRAIEGGPW